jgi:hypothetical protein
MVYRDLAYVVPTIPLRLVAEALVLATEPHPSLRVLGA